MQGEYEFPDQARSLAEQGTLRVRWHPRLDTAPRSLPPDINVADKVEGMLLGLAVGDALGNTSESLNPDVRRRRYGSIDHYLPNRYADWRLVGLPSDDTQLAFRTVAQLNADGHLVPQELGRLIAGSPIFGMGMATAAFVERFRAGNAWHCCGSPRASNGALMRIAPVLLPFLREPSAGLWHDTLRGAHLTHDDPTSNASCVAMVHLLWQLIAVNEPPDSAWWIDQWLEVCDDLGLEARLVSRRAGGAEDFEGTVQELLRARVQPALQQQHPTDMACNSWYSGAFLLETVPSLLYVLARHGSDPRRAILEAVNHTRDNDTIAAVVGAAVGALHGATALPEPWIDDLLGRTAKDDDNRVFGLLRDASRRFGYGIGPVLSRQLERRGMSGSTE